MKAFYRLAEKIKQDISLTSYLNSGDSIYAAEPVFKVCDKHKWKYLFRFKEGRIKVLLKNIQRGISSKLLEAICTRRLTDEDIQQILKPVQVRFT